MKTSLLTLVYSSIVAGGIAVSAAPAQALDTDRSGANFFCQWYDESTGKSAVALSYRRGPAG